jgi:DGQHR domain-containing protein
MVDNNKAELVAHYGAAIDLGICIAGVNLNTASFRGFAPIDQLARVSGPDVYDHERNAKGTQRELNKAHSEDAVEYALESLDVDPLEDPRAFPEVILNARNIGVVEFYSPLEEKSAMSLQDVLNNIHGKNMPVGVRVRLERLRFPIPQFDPDIARVDGNHRLFAIDKIFDEGEILPVFPRIPFALHVGLKILQELKLFTDINGEHVGMQPAIVDTFTLTLGGDNVKDDLSKRPLWIANELTKDEMPFHNMVNFGGSTTGYKAKFGHIPPIKINALKSAVKVVLSSSNTLQALYKERPDVQLQLIENYFRAVKQEFPAQWSDKKNFILLHSTGLNAISMLGSHLIDQAVNAGELEIDFFVPYLQAVRTKVSLEKTDWPGVAGASGASHVYSALIREATKPAAMAAKVAQKVNAPETGISDL